MENEHVNDNQGLEARLSALEARLSALEQALTKHLKLERPDRSLPRSEDDVVQYVVSLGLSHEDGQYLWNHWQSNGFTRAGKPILDWKAACRAWKTAGYFPSQRTSVWRPKTAELPLAQQTVSELEMLLRFGCHRFRLPLEDATIPAIRGRLNELLRRGYTAKQIELVLRWASSPKALDGAPHSFLTTVDPYRFGQWLMMMERQAEKLRKGNK